MQDMVAAAGTSPLIQFGIPAGLLGLLLSIGGLVWRASGRVTLAETKLANTADQLKEHKEASKGQIEDVKKNLEALSMRHESTAAAMGQFREYVATNLVTVPRLQETEGRLSQQIKDNRDATGQQIMALGQQIDRILGERPSRRGAA